MTDLVLNLLLTPVRGWMERVSMSLCLQRVGWDAKQKWGGGGKELLQPERERERERETDRQFVKDRGEG